MILGQDAWADPLGGDSILLQALNKLGRVDQCQRGWSGLLDIQRVPEEFYEWLAERFQRRVPPSEIETLSELPWSAIFTSSVDPTLPRLLEATGRHPSVVLTAEESPPVVRSRSRPPLYYLFSRAGEHDIRALPPTNRAELNTRRIQHALQLLTRVSETATTLGVVLVEGFNSGNDWLNTTDLLGALGSAVTRQVIWFGGPPTMDGEGIHEFDDAVRRGSIIVESKHLSTFIAELNASGRLPSLQQSDPEDAGNISLQEGKRFETPSEERLRIEAAASIVDDTWTPDFLPPLGEDTQYANFRSFHGDLNGARLLVEGILRDFAIERDFEKELHAQVLAAINSDSRRSAPIVLEGQSGTGKSVALARIVTQFRKERLVPVLYAIDRIPQPYEITQFCELAEKAGAKATLMVCDSNKDVDIYHELLAGLKSRGRRVVVLGSQYAEGEQETLRYTRVHAPPQLSAKESNDFADLLERFLDFRPDPKELDDSNILAFLYRALPASRPRIGAGLGAEAMAVQEKIRLRGRRPRVRPPINAIHQQLIELGIVEKLGMVFEDQDVPSNGIDNDPSSRVIDLVMSAGSLNCPVPINLLLRAVTSHSGIALIEFTELFRDLDLFRWESNDSDGSDLSVKPRLTLEAQLLSRRRLGGAVTEADRIVELIASARRGIEREHELRFVLNLLRQFGPDGPRGIYYQNAYIAVAETLTKLRTQHGILDARLMLQESTFRRNAVRRLGPEDSVHLQLLEEARDAVQSALDWIADGTINATRRTTQNLRVELSAIYGFLARYRVDHDSPAEEIWSSYGAARTAIHQAMSAADNYYPHDIGLWTPADLLERIDKTRLTDGQKAEVVADIYSVLDQVDADDLPPSQWVRFQSRRQDVGAILGDQQLSEDAYARLEQKGSTAGYFLRARKFAPHLERDAVKITRREDLEGAQRGAKYLADRFDKIISDVRCLSLMLSCTWISKTGQQLLRGERQALPVGDECRQILNIVQALNEASSPFPQYRTRYLEAVLSWLTSDFQKAREIFRQLSDETDFEYRGRVIRRHVITDCNGKVSSFSGRIESNRGRGNERIRIDGVGQLIAIRGSDFPHHAIRYGRTMSNFAIAFNFIGPIAEPIAKRMR